MIVHRHDRPAAPADACESCEVRAAVVTVTAAGETFRVCIACGADGVKARRAAVVVAR